MNRMLDLLYAENRDAAQWYLPGKCYDKYVGTREYLCNLWDLEFDIMLLLIAVAEGYEI